MPRISEAKKERNKNIVKDWKSIYREGMKKQFVLTQLSTKYDIGVTAIVTILKNSNNYKTI